MQAFLNGTALLFNIIYSAALYLGMAVSLYTIAKRTQVTPAWIAFIPILQFYVIGTLCEEYEIFGFRIRHLEWTLAGLEFLQIFVSFLRALLLFPLGLVINLVLVLILHKFYYLFDPRRAAIYAVLSMLGRLPLTVILFIIKDKPMLMSAGAYPYPFARR